MYSVYLETQIQVLDPTGTGFKRCVDWLTKQHWPLLVASGKYRLTNRNGFFRNPRGKGSWKEGKLCVTEGESLMVKCGTDVSHTEIFYYHYYYFKLKISTNSYWICDLLISFWPLQVVLPSSHLITDSWSRVMILMLNLWGLLQCPSPKRLFPVNIWLEAAYIITLILSIQPVVRGFLLANIEPPGCRAVCSMLDWHVMGI